VSNWPNIILQNVTQGGGGDGLGRWARIAAAFVIVAVTMRACAWLMG
jgi:hypothetical protein